jgi:hypothetical protein
MRFFPDDPTQFTASTATAIPVEFEHRSKEVSMNPRRAFSLRTSAVNLLVVALLAALASVAFAQGSSAQNNATVGIWKLNLAKSKYDPPNLAPKSQTAKIEAAGNGIKNSTEGVASDGSRIAYGYTVSYDGKDYPITGTGAPNGADTIATKRVDANTFESTLKKADKVVLTTRAVYTSTLRTITSKGTNEKGQATNNVSVYDKQ